MQERNALIAMNMVQGIGAATARQLSAHFGSFAAALAAPVSELAVVPLIGQARAEQLAATLQKVSVEAELERAAAAQIQLITWEDKLYPPLLKEIADPPLVLYVAGSPTVLDTPGVAIIGTRHPTIYGRDIAKRMGYQLASQGYTVVSGLAVGIDTEAHNGALQAKGNTVAVLGGALDRFFPRENRGLARSIVESGGAVITEYPFGRQPDRQTFPMRNRIVSGLSRGVLVVEASQTSGTLITANHALEQNRSVMAVPGRIDSPASVGCHKLLREGARLVVSVDDVVDEMHDLLAGLRVRVTPETTARSAEPVARVKVTLSEDEQRIFKHLSVEGAHIDTVIRATGMDAGRVNALLVGLQIRRLVRLLPGGMVAHVQQNR